jgi:hypothetical protein
MNKKFFSFLTILIIFLSFAFKAILPLKALADQDIWVKVTSPNGGETLEVGKNYTITWDSSDNVDKIMLGWSWGPGSLNWIATQLPNTGSYNWNVNVGNTTRTQFKIRVIGYYTGHGSDSDESDNYFTVKGTQASSPTPQPSPSETVQTSPFPSTYSSSQTSPSPTNSIAPQPPPTPKPATSLDTINLDEEFVFEGSKTTNLKEVEDPLNVKDFTLDTQKGWTIVYDESLNLTNPEKISALQNITEYFIIEVWFIVITVDWWQAFPEPIELTYEDKNLTGFEPNLEITAETEEEKETIKNTKVLVKQAKDGEVKASLNGPGKIEIQPKVELLGDKEITTSKTSYTLEAKTSHKDLDYQLKVNGREQDVKIENFDPSDGKFIFKASSLTPGSNFIQLYFKTKEKTDYKLAGEKTIYVKQNSFKNIALIIGSLFVLCFVIIGFIFLEQHFNLSKNIKKTVNKKVNKKK